MDEVGIVRRFAENEGQPGATYGLASDIRAGLAISRAASASVKTWAAGNGNTPNAHEVASRIELLRKDQRGQPKLLLTWGVAEPVYLSARMRYAHCRLWGVPEKCNLWPGALNKLIGGDVRGKQNVIIAGAVARYF